MDCRLIFWAIGLGCVVFVLLVWRSLRQEDVTFVELLDMLLCPKEYKTKGEAGERFVYVELQEIGVPKDQIFRNVYIPVKDSGKTTEIDLLVLSKKGLLVFEHKNYSGRVYGDGRYDSWWQHIDGKKIKFRSPVRQNEYHAKCLREYVGDGVKIYTFITHSRGGEWKVSNVPEEAHFLERKGQFMEIYNSLPNDDAMSGKYMKLKEEFAKLSRPTDGTRERHVERFEK